MDLDELLEVAWTYMIYQRKLTTMDNLQEAANNGLPTGGCLDMGTWMTYRRTLITDDL